MKLKIENREKSMKKECVLWKDQWNWLNSSNADKEKKRRHKLLISGMKQVVSLQIMQATKEEEGNATNNSTHINLTN